MSKENPQTHDDWAEYHAYAFGLAGDEGLWMVYEWAACFQQKGYTVPELVAASRFLITEDPPAAKWEHLPKLRSALQAARARIQEAKRQEKAQAEESPPATPEQWRELRKRLATVGSLPKLESDNGTG